MASDKDFVDPFQGYFSDEEAVERDLNTSLLDFPSARDKFGQVRHLIRNNYYSYQQPLEDKPLAVSKFSGREMYLFSNYDYMGIVGHPAIEKLAIAAIQKYGTGTAGVRLLTGTTVMHQEVEAKIASYKEVEASITFSSGYSANIAALFTLFDSRDEAFLDEKCHFSIVQACKISGIKFSFFRHNNLGQLEEKLRKAKGKRKLIIVEGVYSMEGDICPLPEIVDLKKKYEALLMIDEAHSFGMLGESGRGVHQHFGLDAREVDIWTGSLSKTIPSNGGFIAGTRSLIYLLQHGSPHYIFSSALSPALLGATSASIDILLQDSDRRKRMWANTKLLRKLLSDAGYNTGTGTTPIVPVIIGDPDTTFRLARSLYEKGVFTSPVIYPAVPKKAARIRLCATAAHTEEIIRTVAGYFSELSPNKTRANSVPEGDPLG